MQHDTPRCDVQRGGAITTDSITELEARIGGCLSARLLRIASDLCALHDKMPSLIRHKNALSGDVVVRLAAARHSED